MLDTPVTENEALFRKAATAVWEEGKASTSFIQRKLAIGYNKASRIIELMETLGIVSAADHVGRRDIRSPDELRKSLNISKEIMEAAGKEWGPVVLQALTEGLKTLPAAYAPDPIEQGADQARDKMDAHVRKGRPPMKEDPDFKKQSDSAYRITADELRQFIERVERLEAEKKDIAEQVKEVMAEAKGRGYDTKILRKVIALRKREPDDIAEEEAILEMYKEALGMA